MSIFANEMNNTIVVESEIINNDIVLSNVGEEINQRDLIVQKLVGSVHSGVRQLSKGQDFVVDGKTDTYFWKVVCDGHGTNEFINILRSLDWNLIMSNVDSFATLLDKLRGKSYSLHSGSMLTMVKIYANRVESLCVGDSRVLIYKNGVLVYQNTPHNRKNPSEIVRLAERTHVTTRRTKDPIPHIVSSTSLRGFYGEYIIFENGTEIASTQSLGHFDATGYDPEIHVEMFEEGEHVRVISCSDGFSEMMLIDESTCENAEDMERDGLEMVTFSLDELLEKAEARWKKNWCYYWHPVKKDLFVETAFPDNGYDDIALSIYDNIEGLLNEQILELIQVEEEFVSETVHEPEPLEEETILKIVEEEGS